MEKVEKSSGTQSKSPLFKNPHLYVIIAITSFILAIYTFWPWREWNFYSGAGQWFSWLSLIRIHSLAAFEFSNHFFGCLFIIPIIYTTIVFRWRGSLIISFISVTYIIIVIHSWTSINSMLINSIFLLMPAAVFSAISIEIDLRHKDIENYTKRENERKIYISKVIEAGEQERSRLARELHDDSLQSLLAIASVAEALGSSDENNTISIKNKVGWISNEIHETTKGMHRIIQDLRPSVLEDLGLLSALNLMIEQIESEHDINIQLVLHGIEQNLDPSMEVGLFRIIQESLNNISHHSKAKEAVIVLKHKGESLDITIRDNGQGFIVPKKLSSLQHEGKLGLIGLQERIDFFGGKFTINSKPTKGTKLSIKIPFHKDMTCPQY